VILIILNCLADSFVREKYDSKKIKIGRFEENVY